MHEPSDGIAEEVERQLQLALATAAVAARHAIAQRQHAIEQAGRDSEQAARRVNDQIDAERVLATARLQPVFDPAWWETAGPQDVADMWQEANSWRDPDRAAIQPTIFDHAAGRIREEVRDRSGLDPTQVIALAAVQELEREHQATLAQPVGQPAAVEAPGPDLATSHGFDDPRRREQLPRGSSPRACPSQRSRRERSPTSAKPERPPRPRTPPRPLQTDRSPQLAVAAAANCGASADPLPA